MIPQPLQRLPRQKPDDLACQGASQAPQESSQSVLWSGRLFLLFHRSLLSNGGRSLRLFQCTAAPSAPQRQRVRNNAIPHFLFISDSCKARASRIPCRVTGDSASADRQPSQSTKRRGLFIREGKDASGRTVWIVRHSGVERLIVDPVRAAEAFVTARRALRRRYRALQPPAPPAFMP